MGRDLLNMFWGFCFGTVGVAVLSMIPFLDVLGAPGVLLASLIVTADAESARATFEMMFNGMAYGLLFGIMGLMFGKQRAF